MNKQEKLVSPKSNYIVESLKLNAVPILKMIAVYMVIIIGTEAIFRKSLLDTLEWIVTSPFLFSLNLFTLLAISSVLLLFTKRIVWVTYLVGIVAAILSFVNIGKFALRNVPLLYEDFFLFNEVFILLPQILNPKTIILLVLGVVVGIIIGFALFKFFKKGKLEKHRFLNNLSRNVAFQCSFSIHNQENINIVSGHQILGFFKSRVRRDADCRGSHQFARFPGILYRLGAVAYRNRGVGRLVPSHRVQDESPKRTVIVA